MLRARIRHARNTLKLRQADMADLLEIDLRSYQEYEAHTPPKKGFNPSVLTLRKLALLLQTTVAAFTAEPEPSELQALESERQTRQVKRR